MAMRRQRPAVGTVPRRPLEDGRSNCKRSQGNRIFFSAAELDCSWSSARSNCVRANAPQARVPCSNRVGRAVAVAPNQARGTQRRSRGVGGACVFRVPRLGIRPPVTSITWPFEHFRLSTRTFSPYRRPPRAGSRFRTSCAIVGEAIVRRAAHATIQRFIDPLQE